MIDKLPTFIFIVGHHRSGTSLLHEILKEHRDIGGFSNTNVPEDEGQHLQTLYATAAELGGPGSYIFNKQSYMDERHSLANTATSQALINQWSKHCDFKLPFFIEKSPPTLVRMRFFQSLFPNSKFVILLRHPISIACATKKWIYNKSIHELLEHTLLGYEIAVRDSAYLNHFLVVRYEDIVSNLQRSIDEISAFIGIQTFAPRTKVLADINDLYFTLWDQQYKEECKGLESLEKRANNFGYSLCNPMDRWQSWSIAPDLKSGGV